MTYQLLEKAGLKEKIEAVTLQQSDMAHVAPETIQHIVRGYKVMEVTEY